MCVTDLDPDLDITENEQVPGVAWGQAGKYAGVAWGQLGRQDDQARDAAAEEAGEAGDTEEAGAVHSAS
jgi:hypothetical protein